MSHSIPAAADVASLAFSFIGRLFRTAPAARDEVWDLYRMSRGADSVSPAVLRKLAENAA